MANSYTAVLVLRPAGVRVHGFVGLASDPARALIGESKDLCAVSAAHRVGAKELRLWPSQSRSRLRP